jgi:4-diphosphocytidyl-2-C-methyl-D-erythritol kinase
MGLGGGSSDAAAVLRGLNRLWDLDFDIERLTGVAEGLGSDVAFFLHGGTALAGGRGEIVEPLPDVAAMALTLFIVETDVAEKTKRMYGTLAPEEDFSDGQQTRVTTASVLRGIALTEREMTNVFDGHVGEVSAAAAEAMLRCREAGVAVWAAGSGPGFFALRPRDEVPETLLRRLEAEYGVAAIACRSLSRREALAIREV